MYVGKKVTRVDAYDKVIGRTKYTDDLCDKSAYIARILHSTRKPTISVSRIT